MIDESRHVVAQTVNSAMVWLCWNIGKRIREDILEQKRADYAERIVSALRRGFLIDFGRGFSEPNLRNMIRFGEVSPREWHHGQP